MKLLHQTSKRLITARSIEAAFIAVLIAVVFWLSYMIQDIRRDSVKTKLEIEQSESTESNALTLNSRINNRQGDISRIEAAVLNQQSLGEVINDLEGAALRYGVSLSIPNVEKRDEVDEYGQEIVSDGVFDKVSIQIIARGNPADTLQFFHAARNLPFLLSVSDWNMSISSLLLSTGSNLAPISGPQGRSEEKEDVSDLLIHLVVIVKSDKY